tara:strand:+ start:3286 stop:3471 length:186 start_codon:yes stop_codon:yes gene_type:complete
MTEKELVYMIRDYRDAITLVKNHIELNPVSCDIPMWINELHKLKKRLIELEECLYLGEYDE